MDDIQKNFVFDTPVGVILSDSTTISCLMQIFEDLEKGNLREGMFLIIKTLKNRTILSRLASIVPKNSFYEVGDAWTEARRKKLTIPDEVSRKFEIGSLDLLFEINLNLNQKSDIRIPPHPGDKVYLINPAKHIKSIFGVDKKTRGIIWYGNLYGYDNVKVPLNIENVPMHLAIFGVTGSGKSFDTGVYLEKMSDIFFDETYKLAYPTLIIDANGDYLDYIDYFQEHSKLGAVSWIKRFVISTIKNSIIRESNISQNFIDNLAIDLDLIPLRRLAEMIIVYYKGTLKGADLQINGLERFLESEKDKFGSISEIFINKDKLKNLKSLLEAAPQKIIHSGTKAAVSRALDKFANIEEQFNLFSANSELKDIKFIDRLTNYGGILILDLSANGCPGVPLEIKQLIVTYVASLLFKRFSEYKTDFRSNQKFLNFIVEEAQNFCPSSSYPVGTSLAKDIFSLIATQGRKFGLSLTMITQRPSFVDKIVLSMCNTFIIHRISPEDVKFVKAVTGGLPESLSKKLTLLPKGEFILTGQMNLLQSPLYMKISKSEKLVPHKMGETKVMESLFKNREGL
ncbi:MAG: ATP-binding protein [Promethearchaeota archaeon]